MQQNKLTHFNSLASEVFDLSELIKCPICFELLKNPVELRCNHIFCVSCIERCSSGKQFNCPVCRTKVSKRNLKQVAESEGVIKFVHSVCNQVKNKSNIDVLSRRWNANSDHITSIPSDKHVEPATKEDDKKAPTKKTTKTQQRSINKDKAKEQTTQDRKSSEYVMNWLSNSENQFNRCSPTQQGNVTQSASPIAVNIKNLVSISQVPKRRTLPTRLANKNKLYDRKCKSLERLNAKEPTSNPKLRLDLTTFDTPVDEELIIEEIDSNPNIVRPIVKRLEEQCLQEIDSNVHSSLLKRKEPEKDKDLSTLNNSTRSGWSRINKLNKTIRKVECVPKKLKVTITPKESKGVKSKRTFRSAIVDVTVRETKEQKPLEKLPVPDDITQRESATSQNDSEYSICMPIVLKRGDVETVAAANIETAQENKNEKEKDVENLHKVTLNQILHEIEISKRQKSSEESKSDKLDTSVVINMNNKPGPLKDINEIIKDQEDEMFLSPTQPVHIQPSNQHARDDGNEDEIMVSATQLINTDGTDEISTLTTNCKDLINQFASLRSQLQHVFANNSNSDSISVFAQIDKHLQCAQPKINAICDLLSVEKPSTMEETTTSRTTQTDTAGNLSKSVQTTFVKSPCKCPPVIEKPQMVQQEVQTEPTTEPPEPKLAAPIEFTNTLDFVDFETQAAIKESERRNATLTNVYSEVPVSEILRVVNDKAQGQQGDLLTDVPQSSQVALLFDRKNCRKKLYSGSPGSPVQTVAKRARPLMISDSEDDTPKKEVRKFIRDDVSLCFDSETQKSPKLNSPIVDKFLDDVWVRIQDQMGTSKEKNANEFKTAIKTKTQDIIAKCDQLIIEKLAPSHSPVPPAQPKSAPVILDAVPGPSKLPHKVSSVDLLTDSIFDDDDDEIFNQIVTPSSSSMDKPKSTLHNVLSDLIYKDSSTSIQTRIFDEQATVIKVLQDVRLQQPGPPRDSEDSDEDIIFSTPETTPKRPKRSLHMIAELRTITPPPDFQDPDVLEIDNKQENKENLALTLKNAQLWNITQNTCGLSPIPLNKPQMSITSSSLKQQTLVRRVTSTPISKPLNQTSITKFVRKAPSSALNIFDDDDDLFVHVKHKKSVISCTRLDKEQVIALNALTHRKLAAYSSVFDASVTHMVVATNEENCIRDHTIKYVRAVAAGIWVVNFKWIQDSLSNNKLMPEESYEVRDVTGVEGPKESRLYRGVRPLFANFKVHVAPPFVSTTQADIENTIAMLGGITVPKPEALLPKQHYVCIIISEMSSDDNEIYEDWLEKLRVVTVDIEWLCRSVGQYKLMSLRRFALCSDDSICDLGYPSDLLENVPFTWTQPTGH